MAGNTKDFKDIVSEHCDVEAFLDTQAGQLALSGYRRNGIAENAIHLAQSFARYRLVNGDRQYFLGE